MKTIATNLKLYGLVILISIALSACTHNNGNIGPIFGKWKLTEIIESENSINSYSGNIYWSFQNTTMGIIRVNEYNSYTETYCNWSIEDNNNYIIFDFADDRYHPFPELGMPYPRCEMKIQKLNGSEMILYLNASSNGTPRIYKFIKW